jgi:hypothetical protein
MPTSPLIQLPFSYDLGSSLISRSKHDLGNPKNSFSKFRVDLVDPFPLSESRKTLTSIASLSSC